MTGKRNWRDILLVGTTLGLCGLGFVTYYLESQRNARIDSIMEGEIRGNKVSQIFHVPTCPQYSSIGTENLRTFATVFEAQQANYRPSRNCLEAVGIRNINETESDDSQLDIDHF